MAMVDRRLIVILVAILTPSFGEERCDLEPDTLTIKADDIKFLLEEAQRELLPVFNITDGRCPCLDPAESTCFENQLREANNMITALLSQLANLTAMEDAECPALEGCASFVADSESPDIAIADPVGTILQSIDVNSNISAFTVGERRKDESFSLYFISNNPFVVTRLDNPSLTETTVANETDLPTSGGYGTGITICDDTLYVAIDNSGSGVDKILSLNETDSSFEDVATVSCRPGTLRSYDGRLYYVNCNRIECINKTGGDLQTKFKFPVDITSFDVIDDDRLVFCDNAGGLWIHDAATGCSKLLTCKDNACDDVRINSCTSLVYVVYPNEVNLDIFNSTTCKSAGTLQFTDSAPTGTASLGFEPACLA